jgi:uncharacterized membrane protein YidH (DUF202 family)
MGKVHSGYGYGEWGFERTHWDIFNIFGINRWGTEEIASKLGAVLVIVIGTFAIPIGILLIIAGIKLWRGAKNLENYKSTEKEEDMKEAIKNLSDYFTWIGWMNVVGLVISVFAIVILVLALWYGKGGG